jgi:ATP-dependent exoDNAse (exonuclease V) beta subunit
MSKQDRVPVPDLADRLQAISPEKSFIVQAPAGSGKTELLIQRYLKLLGLVDHPEEIIAITFTRKAAAEMQGRIVNALERARNHVPPKDDATRLTDEMAHSVLARDQKHNWQLEHNPGRLRIQTIDSLCAWLTRQMPVLSGFGAQPETLDDAGGLYQEAAANTLAELENGGAWSDDIAILLAHLDNDLPKVKNMLAGMLARRDQWLRHVATDINRAELEGALKHIVESTLTMTRQAFPEQHVHEFLECLRYATDNLSREDTGSPVLVCDGIDHLPGTTAIELIRWQAIAEFCLTRNDGWRKRVDKNLGFPATTDGKQMKDRFQALLSNLAEHEDLLNQLQEVRLLPPFTYQENEWQVIRALCELLKLADAQLRVIFGERNQVDFTGITSAAIAALETEDVPTDLALHLDYRIRHLLIDEFQDVSINQYRLVEQLTAGWAEGDGHTLFLVGDPMQSIYRFREAEVGLFLTTWEAQRLGQVQLVPLRITVNFRSQKGIVEWVNRAFSEILPKNTDSARGAVPCEQAVAFHQEQTKDAVQIHAFINRDDRTEAERVAGLIKSAQEKNPDGTIAVLVRNRTHLDNIVPVLKQAGLRFRAVEIEPLGRRPAIQDLLALTLALNHYADRIAWLAILRAPWCGLTLSDLHVLAGTDKYRTIRECMQDDSLLQNMTPDGRRRLLRVRTVLDLHFSSQRRRSLRRSVESVWMSLGGPATLEDETDLLNAQAFFDLLDEYDSGGELKHRDDFLESVAGLFAAPDVGSDKRLQIMTIHKAKGLEFDTVIIPGLHRIPRQDDTRLLLWTESPHGSHQDLLLAPVKEAGREKSPVYEYVRRLEKQKQDYEAGRLLYVAATRPRQQLHLLGAVNTNTKGELSGPPSGSLLAQLWPAVMTEFGQAYQNTQPAPVNQEAGKTPAHRLRRLPADWALPLPPAPVAWREEITAAEIPDTTPEYEWAGETIRHIGSVVHRFIQLLAETGIEERDEDSIKSKRDRFEMMLQRTGVPARDIKWAGERVQEALIKMIQDERGRWLLARDHAEQHNEYALTGFYQGRITGIKIDRTFVDRQGTRWLVDYKTSTHEGADLEAFLDREQERYRPQLEKYGTIFKGIDNRPVKLGLYFPLLQGWREWSCE